MNKSLFAILGLSIAISQPVSSEQRPVSRGSQAVNANSKHVDVEFQKLYEDVKSLEQKLENTPAETEDRSYKKNLFIDGIMQQSIMSAGPHTISSKIGELKMAELTNLLGRYGLNYAPNETNVFTWRDNLVVERIFDDYVILNNNTAIVNIVRIPHDIYAGVEYSFRRFDSYLTKDGKFKINVGAEVVNGSNPLIDVSNFSELFQMIKKLNQENRMIIKPTSLEKTGINEVPEFKGLNYDNTRSLFAHRQLMQISKLLLGRIKVDNELDGLPKIGQNFKNVIPRVGGNRIIFSGHSIPYEDKANLEPAIDSRLVYVDSWTGVITLSIGGAGDVNYYFKRECCAHDQTPVYRDLKINFSNSK